MILRISEKVAAYVAAFTAIVSAIVVVVCAYYEVRSFSDVVSEMNTVVTENSKVIRSLEISIKEVPVKILVEHDAGVLFATLNYPKVTERKDVHKVIDSWFRRSSGIQIQSLVNLCKHDKKMLEQIVYSENIRRYCPRFGSWSESFHGVRNNLETAYNG